MAKIFKSPKAADPGPAPKPAPPPPERSDEQTVALAEEQRRRYSSNRGIASTFLTGSGLTERSSATRFLGGGG